MLNLDDITNENNKEHNDKMAIYSRSFVQNFGNWWFWIRKTNALLNLISQQDDIDRIFCMQKN